MVILDYPFLVRCFIKGHEGIKWKLWLACFSLEKWDLSHWNWDLVTGNGNNMPKMEMGEIFCNHDQLRNYLKMSGDMCEHAHRGLRRCYNHWRNHSPLFHGPEGFVPNKRLKFSNFWSSLAAPSEPTYRTCHFSPVANWKTKFKLQTANIICVKTPKPTLLETTRNKKAEMKLCAKMYGKSVSQRNARQGYSMDKANTSPVYLPMKMNRSSQFEFEKYVLLARLSTV